MKNIINARNLFYPFLAFLLGLTVARGLFGGKVDIIVITLLLIITVGVLLVLNKKFKLLATLLLLFLLGNGLFFIGENIATPPKYSGQVSIVGRVKDGIVEGDYNSYTVILDDVKIDGKKGKNVKLTLKNCSETPHAGEIIAYEGELTPIKLFQLGKLNSYDYRKNVKYNSEVYWEDVISITEGKVKFDEWVRLKVHDIIYSNMSERNAGIAYAVLFGDSNGVDYQTKTAYKEAGIIHILTVSGLHIGFLIAFIYFILELLKANKYVRFVITTIFIIFYSYLCGWTPAVLRAGIMAIVSMVAGLIGKQYDGLSGLGFAGFVICLTRPLMSQDVGFLMSFFCVMSIFMVGKIILSFLNKFLPFCISSLIAISVSAQIGVTPFLATFGTQINLLSFIVNLSVIPIFSIVYPLLFTLIVLAIILPFMGKLLVVVDFSFKMINSIVAFFAWAKLSVWASSAYFGVIAILFLIIFGASEYVMIENIKKISILALSSILFATMLGCYSLPQKNNPKIAFINSNSQYSLVLTLASGENVVIGNNSLLEIYKNQYQTGKYNIYISPTGRLSGGEIEKLSRFGINEFISFSSQIESENVRKIEKNVVAEIKTKQDMFSISYLEYQNQYLGMLLNFCNKSIFLANKCDFSYNLVRLQYFYAQQPDVIITDHEDDFSLCDSLVISSTSDIRGDYNYQRDGNLMLTFKGDKITVRGID